MQLKDRFDRVHDYLRISLIDKCNLRCTYCMPEHIQFLPKPHLMTDDEMVDLARIFVEEFGIRKIRLTGGEPLLRKGVGPLIERIGGLGTQLAITTNGLLLHDFLPTFQKVGLRSLNISLDTLREDRFLEITRRSGYAKVMENIRIALSEGFRVKINVVAMRGVNEDEFVEFIRLTEHEDLHIRFIEFMPFDGNKWNWDKVYSYREILELVEKEYPIAKLNDDPHSTAKAYQVEGFKGTFSVISTITEAFCSSCNRIRLTAEGKLRNCLFSKKETDLLTVLRSGEDVRPLIISSILGKHQKLGGLPEFEDEEAVKKALSERAMVKIGG